MSTPLHQEHLQDGGKNQGGPRGTAMPSSGTHRKTIKTIEHSEKPCLACTWMYLVGFVAVVNCVQIERSVEHVQARPCQNY